MSSSAEPLVAVELLSSIARADGASYAGSIVAVRADVATAWIAAGLAKAVPAPTAASKPSDPRRGK